MRYWCEQCRIHLVLPVVTVARYRKVGMPVVCTTCNSTMEKDPIRGRNNNKKRSQAQEKRAAKREGGYVQPASGALSGAKGDVRAPGIRMECKFTRAKSFSLKLEELMKIEGEANANEKPVFEIEFQGVHPPRRYVVLPGYVWDQLRGDHEDDQ